MKADVFFTVTTIAVIVVTAVLTVAFVYLIKILRDVRYMSNRAKEETDKVVKDIDLFRESAKKNLGDFRHLANFFKSLFKIKKVRKK